MVRSTEENLEQAFAREQELKELIYPKLIREAEDEGEKAAARTFSFAKDAEASHAVVYKRALECTLNESSCSYSVCSICGYIVEGDPPESCPVCQAGRSHWKPIGPEP